MSKGPSHRAYVVVPGKKEGQRSFWHEVGVAWPHKNGNGFDIDITPGISVSGRIVCIEPKEPKEK